MANNTKKQDVNFYIPRFVEQKLKDSLRTPIITMITGARQVGKSTLLNRLADFANKEFAVKEAEFSFETNTFMYTLDDIPLRAQLKKDITYIQKDIELGIAESIFSVARPIFVFIDEIQKFLPLLDWIKQVYDKNSNFVKFVITGSSVTGFTKHLTETLAGRIEFVHLTPISLAELYAYRFGISNFFFKEVIQNIGQDTSEKGLNYDPEAFLDSLDQDSSADLEQDVAKILTDIAKGLRTNIKSAVGTYLEHLFYGGMPKVYTMPVQSRRDVLSNYITVYLEREVGYVARNIDLELFGLSLSSFARFNGMPINIQEIAKEVGIARPSIYRYLDLLEQTFLIKKIYPYPQSGKNKMKSIKLVYLDTGLLNVLLNIMDMKDLVTSPYLKQVVLSQFVLNMWIFLSRVGLSYNIYYWQDYEDHAVDLIFDIKNTTVALILDIPTKTDSRKFITTIRNFTNHAKGDNVIFIHPIWDIKDFSLDIMFKNISDQVFDEGKKDKDVQVITTKTSKMQTSQTQKTKAKNVYLLEAPVYFLV